MFEALTASGGGVAAFHDGAVGLAVCCGAVDVDAAAFGDFGAVMETTAALAPDCAAAASFEGECAGLDGRAPSLGEAVTAPGA